MTQSRFVVLYSLPSTLGTRFKQNTYADTPGQLSIALLRASTSSTGDTTVHWTSKPASLNSKEALMLDRNGQLDLRSPAALSQLARLGKRYNIVVGTIFPLADTDVAQVPEDIWANLLPTKQQQQLRYLLCRRDAALEAIFPPVLVRYILRRW